MKRTWLPSKVTPTAAGSPAGKVFTASTTDIFVQVTDSAGQTAATSFGVTITGLEITTNTLPIATVGADYAASIQAAHGAAPYTFTWLIVQGETGLPFGYSLSNNGVVTGIGDNSTGSQQAGTYTFTVQVTDNAGRTAEKQFSLELSPVSLPPLYFITTQLPNAMAGWPYAGGVLVAGSGPFTFTAQGLPEWLQLDSDGTFHGTPPASAAGSFFQFYVEVQDGVYDPTIALNRRTSAMVSLVVGSHQAAQLAVVGGDRQIAAPGAQLPLPLSVRVTRPDTGAPLVGAPVMFNEFVVMTGADGIATTSWVCPSQPGNFQVNVVAAESSAIFQACALTPTVPPGGGVINGSGNNFVSPPDQGRGSSPKPIIADATLEYRAVYQSTGTLHASWSAHYYAWGQGGNPGLHEVASYGESISKSGTHWRTSDETKVQQNPEDPVPPLNDPLKWSPGLTARAYCIKPPDGEIKEVSGLGLDFGGGGNPPQDYDVVTSGTTGQVKGYTETGAFQVRLRRDPKAPQNAEKPAVKRSFIKVTTNDNDSPPTTKYDVVSLTMEANAQESEPLTISTDSHKESIYLLPVEIEEVFERDQKWNKAPSPKHYDENYGYDDKPLGVPPEGPTVLKRTLFIAAEPSSGKVELDVKGAGGSSGTMQTLVGLKSHSGTMLSDVAIMSGGVAHLDFTPSNGINDGRHELCIGLDKNSNGKLDADEVVERPQDKKFWIRAITAADYSSNRSSIAWKQDGARWLPGKEFLADVLETFLGDTATLAGSTSTTTETVPINRSDLTHIAGSTYNPSNGETTLDNFQLPDGSGATL